MDNLRPISYALILLVMLFVISLLTMSCAPDLKTITGPQGVQGIPGQSITGAQGPAGADGKIATVVQLCPNSVDSYPTVFAEVALCINNDLYAVYSANGGFLTLLIPGAYTSDAIGSACDLTVLPNCAVQ